MEEKTKTANTTPQATAMASVNYGGEDVLAAIYRDPDEEIQFVLREPPDPLIEDYPYHAHGRTATVRELRQGPEAMQELRVFNQVFNISFLPNYNRPAAFSARINKRTRWKTSGELEVALIQPSIVIEGADSETWLWLIKGDCNEEQLQQVQDRLNKRTGRAYSKSIKAIGIFLPGFDEYVLEGHDDVPVPVRCTRLEPEQHYTIEQMLETLSAE
jgi:hypothetical protein